jgi:hypothetical protein
MWCSVGFDGYKAPEYNKEGISGSTALFHRCCRVQNICKKSIDKHGHHWYFPSVLFHGPLAQLAEQLTLNQ